MRLFDPLYTKKKTHSHAMELVKKMCPYHILNTEEDNIVNLMKKGWHAYRTNVSRVLAAFEYEKDDSVILSWHYRLFLRLEEEQKEDKKKG